MGRFLAMSWMLAVAGVCDAEALSESCPSTAPPLSGLRVTHCERREDAVLIRYTSPPPASPFATDFDRRFVVVVLGPTAAGIERIAGIEYPNRRVRRTALVEPPMAEGAERVMGNAPGAYRDWTIFIEEIRNPPGREAEYPYVLRCATAVRLRTRHYAAVAECFPPEGRSGFLVVLESVE